jgi:hypothetical protein
MRPFDLHDISSPSLPSRCTASSASTAATAAHGCADVDQPALQTHGPESVATALSRSSSLKPGFATEVVPRPDPS